MVQDGVGQRPAVLVVAVIEKETRDPLSAGGQRGTNHGKQEEGWKRTASPQKNSVCHLP